MGNDNPKCCNNCKWYRWYWDACVKWKCEVYYNAVYSCFEPRDDEVDDAKELQSDTVVHCKDCKRHTDEISGMVYCPHIIGGWCDDDWFCKSGERREVNKDV